MRLLLEMRVFMAGCGGLGGAVADMLARTGIGMFRLCDPDVFEETNLNRQLFWHRKRLAGPRLPSSVPVCWALLPISLSRLWK